MLYVNTTQPKLNLDHFFSKTPPLFSILVNGTTSYPSQNSGCHLIYTSFQKWIFSFNYETIVRSTKKIQIPKDKQVGSENYPPALPSVTLFYGNKKQ